MKDSVRIDVDKRSIFRVGEVYSVSGREISIKVDMNKNSSHLMYCGQLIKNVSVGGYLKILKGFDVLVVKVESEYLKENSNSFQKVHTLGEENFRILIAKLIGYFDGTEYKKGVKELPLIGNECILIDNESFSTIHKFAKEDEDCIEIGHLMSDRNVSISISVDKLFASHIGIFGNTGSGKSHTLASLYQTLFNKYGKNKKFNENAKFILFDFNGEYYRENVITSFKQVYNLSTLSKNGDDRIPLHKEDLLKPELFSILCSASEKTQQPFIRRALHLYERIQKKDSPLNYVQGILQNQVSNTLVLSDRVKSKLLLDYFEQILPHDKDDLEIEIPLQRELDWFGNLNCYYRVEKGKRLFINGEKSDNIKTTDLYHAASKYLIPENFLDSIVDALYIQLINDVLSNRAQNDHIAPVINKLKSFIKDFDRTLCISEEDFWQNKNLVVINLNHCNILVKKMIPMLVSYQLYEYKKKAPNESNSLNIIIDEAHNILSFESLRESESFKDFRLETFEEIIKEGRKFGVFLTLSSQRPSDISGTIISQLHNYLIHRLVNNKDIEMIEKAVSYLDKVSAEQLPILPVGACVLSGFIADLPIIMQVNELPRHVQPKSQTIKLTDHWKDELIHDIIEENNEEVAYIDDEDL